MRFSEKLKVAIVHDDFVQEGGAERLVLAMLELWPQADVYAILATTDWQKRLRSTTQKAVRTSWLQSWLWGKGFHRYYYAFYPLAIESFRWEGYDLVISSSSRYAHGIITQPGTLHIAYVNSPARFLWQEDLVPKMPGVSSVLFWHRNWDLVAAQRPDFVLANSRTPALRIERFWRRKADGIVYPFVDLPSVIDDERDNVPSVAGDYFILISRLVRWKRTEIAVEACNRLACPLWIVGQGPENRRLRELAGPTIRFLESVDEVTKFRYLSHSRALIVPQEEDFGIVILEANACGVPVIAYRSGGATELIEDGRNGFFFDRQDPDSLVEALSGFDRSLVNRQNCLELGRRFTKERFKREIHDFVESKMILSKL